MMCYGFSSTALPHTGVNWVYWGTLTEDFVSVKPNTLEKGGTVKLFYPKDFYISGASCETEGYPGMILAAGQSSTHAVLEAY